MSALKELLGQLIDRWRVIVKSILYLCICGAQQTRLNRHDNIVPSVLQ